jgi:polyisoprenoid-binding protein YceI
MSTLRWLVLAVVAVAVLAVAGPWIYINLIEGDAPDELSLDDVTTTTSAGTQTTVAGAGIEGAWEVTAGSQAGYRVQEVLFGQDATAVGRTEDVTGTLTIAGRSVTAGSFTVDLTTVSSDQSRRDGQFHGRIMDTATFPTAVFELTEPIALTSEPEDGAKVTATATGDFTIHGVEKTVTFDLIATRANGTLVVNGSIPVTFADYGIGDPSFGPAVVQDHGVIEFLLVLGPAA